MIRPDPYALARPLLLQLEPEAAHRLAILALRSGVVGALACPEPDDAILATRVWGRAFSNPIGMAAGFDKNGEVIAPLLRLGFGFVEVGTVTPRAQAGNPTPRVFRWPERQAMINRLGFNNHGAAALAARLAADRRRRGSGSGAGAAGTGVLGVNIGRNKDSADAVGDFVAGVRAFASLADYLVVNISSPNTPGLRALQERSALVGLIQAVLTARAEAVPEGERPPLLVKIAPDLGDEDLADVVDVVTTLSVGGTGVGGMIVSNTTVTRPDDLPARLRGEAGGLSGPPLFARSTRMLADVFRATGGRMPLIGVGGVGSAADAYAKIRAGASLVQLYTAMVYQGPRLLQEIKRGLAAALRADGFRSVAEAVGRD